MKLKNITQLVVMILLVLSLIACGSSLQDEGKGTLKTTEKTAKNHATTYQTILTAKHMKQESEENIASLEKSEESKAKDKHSNDNKEPVVSEEKEGKKSKDEKEPKMKPDVSKASGTFFVTAPSLNVRSGDGTNYPLLGSLSENNKVNVTGKTSNGWYEFTFKDKKGYVSAHYLSEEKVAAKPNDSNPPATTEPSKSGNIVDQMKNLGNSQQVILVTTNGYSTSTGQIRTFEKDSNGKWNQILNSIAHIGKNGFADNKVEGDGKSPTGKYSVGHAFGYEGNPGTKLSFKNSTANDVWVDDPSSAYYNTWQDDNRDGKDWNSAETMMHRLYNYGFTINYNTTQTPNKGSAIFMHVGNSYTVGCTATNQIDLIAIMKWIDPSKNPVMIQTPESGLGNY